jgi:hypothetical protein
MFALLLLAAPPSAYLPCQAGLSIEYKVEPAGGAAFSMTETVQPSSPKMCLLEQTVRSISGRTEVNVFARELLEDRVLNAGYAELILAFRPPLLVAPIERGKKWRYQTTDYEIEGAGVPCEVPGGKFEDCVRVRERSRDGKHEATSVYARDVGLVMYESRDRRIRATRIVRPDSKKTSGR